MNGPVVGRSSSAGMLAPITLHISAATFPIVCVDSVPPVPGRAGKLRSLTDDAGFRKRARSSGNPLAVGCSRPTGRG